MPSANRTVAYYVLVHEAERAAGCSVDAPGVRYTRLESPDRIQEFLQGRPRDHVPALVIVDGSLLAHLMQRLDTAEGMLAWVVALADSLGHPVALHLDRITTFLSPLGWGEERLQGWTGGHAATVQDTYGQVSWSYGPCSLTLPPQQEAAAFT